MQTLLIAAVIFMGFQLFFGNKGPADTRTADQILKSMQDLNKQVDDPAKIEQAYQLIQQERSKLESKLGEDVQAKKLSKPEANSKSLQGMVLTGDALFKAGVLKKDTGPLTQAYYMLHGQDKTFGHRSWLENRYAVNASEKFAPADQSAKELYDRLVAELRVQFHDHLINGMIPGFQVIDVLVNATGAVPAFSYAFAALLLALLVRAVVWPLTQKQYRWGRQMAQLQPLMKELRERYKDKKTGQVTDAVELNKKMMELYRDYGINPMSGCAPMLIQIPFFLVIYQCMQNYRFEFQNGVFLWINPGLSQSTNGFVAPNLGEKDNILVAIYAVSMVVTTLLTPVSDPANMKQQRIMGVSVAVFFSITMFFYPLPSAFVLYWVALNVFATAQMLYVYKHPVPPLVKKNAPGGGVFPTETPAPSNGQPKTTGKPVKHKPKKKR